MSLDNLVDALNHYALQKKRLEPENYVTMDAVRAFVPDWLPMGFMGPPGMHKGPDKQALLADILAGNPVPDEYMLEAFGFTNAELQSAWKASDPVVKPVPEKLVLMTFDDSTIDHYTIDHYTIAAPILEKYGGKGVFFTTEMKASSRTLGFEDKSAYMTWEQIKELSERGHEIGNHSLHHDLSYSKASLEDIRASVAGLEERCSKYDIPKPITIGYPGGMVTPQVEQLLHEMGYLWGRGSMVDCTPRVVSDAIYDPHLHTPMVVPGTMPASKEQLVEILSRVSGGKVLLRVFHDLTDTHMNDIPFEEEVAAIYENGGRCVTFRELMEYIDPVKAWNYMHPQMPELLPMMDMPPMPPTADDHVPPKR